MRTFLQRFGQAVCGILCGFDRLRFRGSKRMLSHARGFLHFLHQVQVPLTAFKAFALEATHALKTRTQADLLQANRPLIYLRSNSQRKDHLAREIAARDGITQGTICVFSTLELGSTLLFRSGPTGRLDLQPGLRKCLHYYHYFLDPEVGFGHVRVQTWFPFGVHIYLNGREWLAQQMDRAGLGYVRQDNCFTALHDYARAQALADEQQRVHWPTLLDRLTRPAVAGLEETFAACPVPYYWSLEESEWASDVVFRDPAELQRWYPLWLRHGMSRLSSKDVLRFLGKKMPRQEGRYWNFEGEVLTDLKERAEGVRIKHWVGSNSIKMYDKQGVVLRIETTLNDPAHLKVYRPKEGGEADDLQWRRLRKGVADVHRRAEVCQASNARYLESLATVQETEPLGELTQTICSAVKWQGRRARALNPLGEADGQLLRAVNRGEYVLAGFRNADVRQELYGASASPEEQKRQSAAVTRQLRLLRAHGLIRKIPKSHRYQVSDKGRAIIAAVLVARDADAKSLVAAA